MKQKLLTLLAVLLTGGILVACGPGDETAQDPAGGGVVDEPLAGEPGEADTFGDPAAADTFDEGAAEEPTAEGETVEMDLEEPVAEEDAPADDAAAADAEEGDIGADVTAEADAEGEEVAGGGAAAPAEGEAIVINFSQAAEGVAVDNVQGAEDAEQVANTEETNPALNLTVGERYEFAYDGEGDLVFLNADDQPILSTAGTDSAFAEDSEVAAESQDGRLSFTLTEDLAQELDHYAAGPDEQGGQINAN